MTIALGILATDGVLIASDREESLGDFKYSQNKIRGAHHWTFDAQRNLLLAGAGDAHFIDVFAQSIQDAILGDERLKDAPRVVFDEALDRFYTRKVIPCDPFNGGPDFQLVIAYQGHGRSHLFKSQHNSVLETDGFVVVGSGATVVQPLLSRLLGHRRVSLRQAVVIASYAVIEAKDAVQGVGKDTDIITMFSGGKLERTVKPMQRELDEVIDRYRDELEPMLIRAIAGSVDPTSMTSKIQKIRDKVDDILGASFTDQSVPTVPQSPTDDLSSEPPSHG